MASKATYQFNGCQFDPLNHQLTVGGETRVLEHKVAALLTLFCQRPQQPLTKEEIISHVWADRVVNEDSLAVAVSKIRKLLGDTARKPTYLRTIAGVGYIFMPEVEVSHHDAVAPNSASNTALSTSLPRFKLRLTKSAAGLLLFAVFAVSMLQWKTAETVPEVQSVLIEPQQLPPAEQELFNGAQLKYGERDQDRIKASIVAHRELANRYPNLLAAHLNIAQAKLVLVNTRGYADRDAHIEEIDAIADYLMQKFPNDARVWSLKAGISLVLHWQLDQAEEYFEKAIELAPENPQLYLGYTELLITRQKFDEAERVLTTVRRQQPALFQYLNLSYVYWAQRDWKKALAELDRLVNSEAPSRLHHHMIHRTALALDNEELAADHLWIIMRESELPGSSVERYKNRFMHEGLAGVFATLLEEQAEANVGHYVPPLSWARYAVLSNQPALAMQYLREAADMKQTQVLLLHVDPLYDPLRQRPDFQALLGRLPQ